MKKVLLVVAMLVITVPALATVSVTATDKGSGVVEVRYNCSAAEKVRSFALDISVDSSTTIDKIRDFNSGESKKAGGGYGIFPGAFAVVINASNPNWADPCYTPVAPVTDSNARTGIGTGAITVELGTLYVDTNSPGASGLLFRLDINSHGASDCNLRIVQNNTRVGVVLEDTNIVTSPVLTGTKVTFALPCVVPNLTGMNRVAGIQAIINGGWVKGVENNVPPTIANEPVGTIIGQNPPSGLPCPPPGSAIDINVVSYPVKDAAPNSLYANWVTNGRPQCWAFPRQCRGDADGKKSGQNWVASSDLAILKGAFTKNPLPPGGTCADLDHKKTGQNWVASSDLTTIKIYFTKAESLVPICGNIPLTGSADSNYWYWCMPSGTCPTGQLCAPVAVCPNTP
jgi:hypothetical protein